MVEPKYKINDWVKLHRRTAIDKATTYLVIAIRIEIFGPNNQAIVYQLREHRVGLPASLRSILVTEREIEAQVGSTKD